MREPGLDLHVLSNVGRPQFAGRLETTQMKKEVD